MDTRVNAERVETAEPRRVLRGTYDPDGNTTEIEGLLTGYVVQEDDRWHAYCRELGLTEQGETAAGAVGRLDDAIRRFFAEGIEQGTLGRSLARLSWRCTLPEGGLVDCDEDPIPERLLPECRFEPMERNGAEWSRRFRFRDEPTEDSGLHRMQRRRHISGEYNWNLPFSAH
jgi:hypothetical protein